MNSERIGLVTTKKKEKFLQEVYEIRKGKNKIDERFKGVYNIYI